MIAHHTTPTEALCSPSGSTSSASSSTNCSNSNSNQSLSPNNTIDNNNNNDNNHNDNNNGNNGMEHDLLSANDESHLSTLQANQSKLTSTATASLPQTFSLIALKTIATANGLSNSHAISSAHNPNKLVKMQSDCFDAALLNGRTTTKSLIIGTENNRNNNNILDSAISLIANKASSAESAAAAAIKANLPNLGNFSKNSFGLVGGMLLRIWPLLFVDFCSQSGYLNTSFITKATTHTVVA